MKLSKTLKTTESEMLFSRDDEKVEMRIDQNAMAHIINRLTDMYPNPIEATVREVISNATDTTRRLPEADRKPIKVILPTELNREFKVIDLGEGMSKDTIRTVYSQYGASTKGDDLSQIGAYGLGAKAPLSYCTQFTVESTCDGITTEILISSENGGNYTRFLGSEETGLPNGTKVIIPVEENDAQKFVDAAENYHKYSIGVSMEFVGADFGPKKSLIHVGEIPFHEIQEGFAVDIYSDLEDNASLFNAFINDRMDDEFGFFLSGWDYSPRTYGRQPRLYVDLVPGLVDFSSSRDQITTNSRFTQFKQALADRSGTLLLDAVQRFINEGTLSDEDVLRKLGAIVTSHRFGNFTHSKFIKELVSPSGMNYYDKLSEITGDDISLMFYRSVDYNKHIDYSKKDDSSNPHNFTISQRTNMTALRTLIDENAIQSQSIIAIATEPHFETTKRSLVITDTNEIDERKRIVSRTTQYFKVNNSSLGLFIVTPLTQKQFKKKMKGIISPENVEFMTLDEYMELTKPPKVVKQPKPKSSELYLPLSIRSYTELEDALRSSISSSTFSDWNLRLVKTLEEKYEDHKRILLIKQNVRDWESIPNMNNLISSHLMEDGTKVMVGMLAATQITGTNYEALINFFDEFVSVPSEGLKFRTKTVTEAMSSVNWVTPPEKIVIAGNTDLGLMRRLAKSSDFVRFVHSNFIYTNWNSKVTQCELPENANERLMTLIEKAHNENRYSRNDVNIEFSDNTESELDGALKAIEEYEELNGRLLYAIDDVGSLKEVGHFKTIMDEVRALLVVE